ncbi:diguanylate cyclase [Oceanospirillum sp. D5]|uniref:Diguanylate cyclase n=2 Tax=Oceanospirillum sediminis TaxID=2760088 RepID=A0A839IT82_9GAMM|nr:diguanylate cyclase [Oceanospirillum sediminis]
MSGKKDATRQAVEVAFGVLVHYQRLVENRELSAEEAKDRAKEAIKGLRYSSREYFWINDTHPRMIMHPTAPRLNGTDLSDFADPNGTLLFKEFVSVTNVSGSGFIGYMWPKPGEQAPVEKLSYVKSFKPWGWIVGSGIYLDDVQKEILNLRNLAIAGGVFFALLTMALAWWIGSSLTKRLERVIDGLKDVAQGKGDVDLRKRIAITSIDEIGALSTEFNALMESISDLTTFRKVIEEDDVMEDVYSRLYDVFTDDLKLKSPVIFEVDDIHKRMKPVYPLTLNEDDQSCNQEILDNCNLCKAKRTGHGISSYDFPKICKQFIDHGNAHHVCIPMTIGGSTIGVVQFNFNGDEDIESSQHVADQIDKASQYIKEALPVIESKRLTATLRESALCDPLTGLHNRRFLQESATNICSGALRRNKTIGLLMCDLDYFKQVNDTHGHDAGDLILVETSKILKKSVRDSDLIFRFGGEEFFIMLVDVEPGEALSVAEKMCKTFEDHQFTLDTGERITKTISIGVSEFPGDDESLWKGLKYADVALYQAKDTGRNKAMRFTREMWKDDQY